MQDIRQPISFRLDFRARAFLYFRSPQENLFQPISFPPDFRARAFLYFWRPFRYIPQKRSRQHCNGTL